MTTKTKIDGGVLALFLMRVIELTRDHDEFLGKIVLWEDSFRSRYERFFEEGIFEDDEFLRLDDEDRWEDQVNAIAELFAEWFIDDERVQSEMDRLEELENDYEGTKPINATNWRRRVLAIAKEKLALLVKGEVA